MSYKRLSDKELVKLAQLKDEKAMNELIEKYKCVATSIARSYFLIGGDSDDLLQEGMVGIFNAINSYDEKKGEFKTYVYSCVKNRIISCIKSSNTKKNEPLNGYVSLSSSIDDGDKTFIIQDTSLGPEESLIVSEAESELNQKLKDILSLSEYNILGYYIDGLTYTQISERVNKTEKSVDNALQRIKRKINELLCSKK